MNGGATAFYFPASAGVIPQTVPQPILQEANALLSLTGNATQIGGAAIAGFLIAAFGSGVAIAVDAATYLLGAAILSQMRLLLGESGEARRFLGELAAGWREVRGRTWLWTIVLQFSLLLAS